MAKKSSKKTRGKGKTLDEKSQAAFDAIVLDILKNGQVVEDPKTGELIRKHPSAAMLSVCARRIKEWEKANPNRETPQDALKRKAAERRGYSGPNPAGAIRSVRPDGV